MMLISFLALWHFHSLLFLLLIETLCQMSAMISSSVFTRLFSAARQSHVIGKIQVRAVNAVHPSMVIPCLNHPKMALFRIDLRVR